MSVLKVEFESGERASPADVEKMMQTLIPGALKVQWLASFAIEHAGTASEESPTPILFRHVVEVVA